MKRSLLVLALVGLLLGIVPVALAQGDEPSDASPVDDPFLLEGNEPALANNIVVTIDDCSIEWNVQWAYKILKNRGLTATFFPNTETNAFRLCDQDPQLWRDIVASGSEIGYHTRWHASGLTPDELDYDFDVFTMEIREILGDPNYTIHYARPPRGVFDENWVTWIERRGLISVPWNSTAPDMDPDLVAGLARNRVEGGSVLLLHAGQADIQWLQDHASYLGTLYSATGEPFRLRSITDALND